MSAAVPTPRFCLKCHCAPCLCKPSCDEDRERALFEKWMKDKQHGQEFPPNYSDLATRLRWQGWKARAMENK